MSTTTRAGETDWSADPLGYLISPCTEDEFFATYFEKKALIVARQEPDRYGDLLSMQRIDDLLAEVDFTSGALDMARADPPVSRDELFFESGVVDRGAVARNYQQGATLILPQLHATDGVLKRFCRAVESRFSTHIQTNIYLTPPNAQGFRTHYDDHDVFVAQIHGEKRWRLYDVPVENPYRGEGFQPGKHAIGEPVEEFVLKAGDMAYVPRGMLHDASTAGDGPSLHITIGLIVKTWADVLLEAVSEVALREPAFRRSLPPGFANPDFDRAPAEAYFAHLVEILAKEAALDSALDLFADNFIRSRLPDSAGTIIGFDAPDIAGAKFRLREHTPWRLAGDEERLELIAPGGEIKLPLEAEPAMDAVLSGEPFGVEAFSMLEPDKALDTLKLLYAYGMVERA